MIENILGILGGIVLIVALIMFVRYFIAFFKLIKEKDGCYLFSNLSKNRGGKDEH